MRGDGLIEVFDEVAVAVRRALDYLTDWGPAGTTKAGQYYSDLAADQIAIELLTGAGLGVLSEETGLHHADRDILVVLDPVDGSTNAARRIPWFATSLCAVDAEGPLAALVVNQSTGTRYEAMRGVGARRNGEPISPSTVTSMDKAVIGLSGYPARHLGWRQCRMLGAAALDLCLVAEGGLDAYVDCGRDAHGPWDYLGGLLICLEAGAVVSDARGRELVVRGHGDRRTPCAAATPQLLEHVLAARNSGGTEN